MLQNHINAHLSGALEGEVPDSWLRDRGKTRCLVCGLCVSEQRGIHPTCRPEARAAAGVPDAPRGDDGGGAELLPSVEDVQSARTPTLRHVPAAARHSWCQVVTRALAAVAHHNDQRSWQELLMLPQAVLCPPPRRGRKHIKAAAAFTLDRLQRWQQGERLQLWHTRHVPRSRRAGPPTAAEKRDLATSLGREGFDRKACTALLSEGLLPPSADTARALEALHPVGTLPSTPAMHELPLAPELAAELVARALREFPTETAPGPTGLRVQHLREACVAGSAEHMLTQLTAVVNILAQGRAPAAVAPVLAGAGLVALPKPTGGVRPIAVGEVLRRLTGKCLMAMVKEDARAYFWPAQVGVAVPGGAEKAIHSVRAWVHRHSEAADKVLLKLDFSNAFNCVSREAVLSQARTHFPALARWAAWCYREPSRLQFGDRVISSSSGVQQGDPLGPLLFSAVLQPVATQLRAGDSDLALQFLDDGIVAGSVRAVAAALSLVQREAADVGLALNLSKCEVVAMGSLSDASLLMHFPSALLRSADGSSRVLREFEFLGAPIGPATFVSKHTKTRAEKANALLEALAELEDPQIGLRLLRACAGYCRMVHSMRCAPSVAQAAALTAFDGLVRGCFGGLTGLHLTESQWAQAAGGFSHAGIGLRACERHAPAAYLASLGSSLDGCRELDPQFDASAVMASPDVLAALEALNAQLPAAQRLTAAAALSLKQRQLSQLLDAAAWETQLAQASLTDKALLRSEAGLGARAFLVALPSGRTHMEKASFVAELRFRLRLPDATEDTWCPKCDAVLDRFSHHAAVCVAGGERTLRHNAVRDAVFTWAERAGLHPEKERPGLLLPQSPEDVHAGRRRPADLYLPAWLGSPVAFDFAITAPQRQETLAQASVQAGAAAEAYARHKESYLDTAAACAAQGVRFVPLVVETTGHWEAAAGRVLKQIAGAVAARTGSEPGPVHDALLQELSVVVRSCRARAALRRRAELDA